MHAPPKVKSPVLKAPPHTLKHWPMSLPSPNQISFNASYLKQSAPLCPATPPPGHHVYHAEWQCWRIERTLKLVTSSLKFLSQLPIY